MNERRIAAVILAAGLSSRCPGNKLLQTIAGKPVVRYVVEAAIASKAIGVLVVVGHDAEKLSEVLSGLPVAIVNNAQYASGLSSSLRCAVQQAPADSDGLLVLLGDMPFVTAAVIDDLIEQFDPTHGHEICVPMAKGRQGNPVLWGRRFFAELTSMTGDNGGKSIIGLHRKFVVELDVEDDGVLIDIDTVDDVIGARK